MCGEESYSKKRINNHMDNYHAGPFKCFDKQCQTAFKGSQERKNHYLFFHNQDLKVTPEIIAIQIDILLKSFLSYLIGI